MSQDYSRGHCRHCGTMIEYAKKCPVCGFHHWNDGLASVWKNGYLAQRGKENIYKIISPYRNAWQAGYDWRNVELNEREYDPEHNENDRAYLGLDLFGSSLLAEERAGR